MAEQLAADGMGLRHHHVLAETQAGVHLERRTRRSEQSSGGCEPHAGTGVYECYYIRIPRIRPRPPDGERRSFVSCSECQVCAGDRAPPEVPDQNGMVKPRVIERKAFQAVTNEQAESVFVGAANPLLVSMPPPTANRQPPTASSQQPAANSQQPTANSQQPQASSLRDAPACQEARRTVRASAMRRSLPSTLPPARPCASARFDHCADMPASV